MEFKLDTHEILKKAFPGIQKNVADELLVSGVVRRFPPNTTICQEGALEDTFYIILNGEVRVSKMINDEEDRLLTHLSNGDFFGEMAIIHNAPRSATVETTLPTEVLEIRKEVFTQLVEQSSSMSLAMVRAVSNRLRNNDDMAIEDLREKARELAGAYQHLAELEHARSEFLSTIAHELRTPLMAANGFMQVIRTGKLQGQALQSAVETVSRNIEDIIALTNDILFLQEMDLILPDFRPTDAGAVMAAAVESQHSRASRNNISLKLDIAAGLPTIPADPNSLERAFSAILDNAIKFSPNGGEVSIRVYHTATHLMVSVHDNGVGIPPESMPHIFDRFYHLDQVGEHLFRGIGLGLSVARQVIEQHKGEIVVQSELGKGSEFTIRMRLSRAMPHFTGPLKM